MRRFSHQGISFVRGLHSILSSRGLGCLLIGLSILVTGFAVFKFLDWQAAAANLSAKDRIEAEAQALQTLAQIVGGAFLFLTVFFTWRNVVAAEKTVAISQEGQVTDRFTKAIEQLGSDKLEMRLGGIYALERIARDSEKDYWPIVEILTTYVRENAPWEEQDEEEQNSFDDPKPRADIQAILTVLGRRVHRYAQGEEVRLDLARTDLRGADLREAHLEGAILIETHLEEAFLRGAYLEKAILYGAYLDGANLSKAHLQETDLRDVSLDRADLEDAKGLKYEQIKQALIEDSTKLPLDIRALTNGTVHHSS